MTYTFDYTFRARISEQSELDVSGSFDIDAYDEIDVAVPADNTTVPVRIRGASTAQVVIITSSDYHQLEYHAGDRTRAIQLDRPHILTSAGLLARLGLTSGRLYFRKGGGDDAAVRIFVGTGDDRERYAHELGTTEIEPQRAEGGRYPAAEFDLEARLNEAEEDRPFYVPRGPERGEIAPANPELPVKEIEPDGKSGDAQAPLRFEEYDETDDASPTAHTLVPEPSVAENGETVMTTGNFWVSLSLDAGQTFTTMNPTTIFPEDYGGFCCDQVLQYVPEFDLFVWLLQYRLDGDNVNAIRIAVQDTQGVRNSGGTAWTYWDFRNTVFASSGMLDYNDMSFGNTFLYWTSSVGGGANRYVVRVPLAQLQAQSTVNFQYTGSTDAYWSHVTQNGRDGVYWAGHVNNSTLKVYSMMDADGFYSWREVPINSWPNNTMTSIAANGSDWLKDASWKTYIRAAAIHGNSAYFAWNASSGDGFPEPHIQIARINTNTFKLEDQMQIWNPDFAFAYPYFETNVEGQLGMIVAFGGGPYDSSSGVGVWGDFVIYYPRLSSSSAANYGHYHTVRRAASDAMQWVGAGYIREADNTIVPYYVRFSR